MTARKDPGADPADRPLDALREAAEAQGGVMSRPQLYARGVSRDAIRAHLNAGRWHRVGRQTLFVLDRATVPDGVLARHWRAVLEVGADAALDGASALVAAGLRGFEQVPTQVSVSRGSRYRRPRGVRVYETRRRRRGDLVPVGVPRTHPPVACVRAALWAPTMQAGALAVALAVQQRIVRVPDVSAELAGVRRHPRRRYLLGVLADLATGTAAMGGLDLGETCRRQGLPEPSRQVVRVSDSGAVYLDVDWDEWGVTVEIGGDSYEAAPDGRVLRVPFRKLHDEPVACADLIRGALVWSGWR